MRDMFLMQELRRKLQLEEVHFHIGSVGFSKYQYNSSIMPLTELLESRVNVINDRESSGLLDLPRYMAAASYDGMSFANFALVELASER